MSGLVIKGEHGQEGSHWLKGRIVASHVHSLFFSQRDFYFILFYFILFWFALVIPTLEGATSLLPLDYYYYRYTLEKKKKIREKGFKSFDFCCL